MIPATARGVKLRPCSRCGADVRAYAEEPYPVGGFVCREQPCRPVAQTRDEWVDERDAEYEKQCRRDGVEP